jgi:hypothetical protein
VDAQGWPLLTDTGSWGMWGVDLGANTEHADGRLYFFFGDVAEVQGSGILRNADLVAWTDDRKVLRHGGHQALGWTFYLPSREAQGATDATGQRDWRFCSQCNGLFWAPEGNPALTVCPAGGQHDPLGWTFYLPSREGQGATDATGQPDWRSCANCHGLFWAPDGNPVDTVCPAGGQHDPLGWTFYLPSREAHGATDATGQPDWRFCGRCHGLFYDGYPRKGLCAGAPGGGIRLSAVLNERGVLDPFSAPDPIGVTESNETPSGAFSFGGTACVFAGIGERRYTGKKRPGDPTYGNYLHSKDRPNIAGPFHTEFLFSPRIGCCPRDASRTVFESHAVLGLRFVLPHDGGSGAGWRACARCQSLFWNASDQPSVCHKGGSHAPEGSTFVLNPGLEDMQHQGKWCRCGRCAMMFWDGDPEENGLCPAGKTHTPDGFAVVVPHASFEEDAHNQDHWRFCGKCAGLFREDWSAKSVCPTGDAHAAWGFEFVLPHSTREDEHHQGPWRCCKKCGGMFWMGARDTSRCPEDQLLHEPTDHPQSRFEFFLPYDLAPDGEHQDRWQFCTRCAGMFWNGDFKGVCPKGGPHDGQGFNFVLAHNPGRDPVNQDRWRFCTKCFGMVNTGHPDVFAGVGPCVVKNADHPYLPQGLAEFGVVLLGFGYEPGPKPASRLAWMPLREGERPRLEDTRYYTGDSATPWSDDSRRAAALFEHGAFTSISLAWLDGPRRWICLYSKANDTNRFDGPAVGRFGKTLWDWSPEITLFDPHTQEAYGVYMHKVGSGDRIHPDLPPAQDLGAGPEHDGWAYGAYILNRFTEWDEPHRELGIYYLLSLSSPYQVQLMHTRLHIPDEASHTSGSRHLKLFHGGNGRSPVGGLTMQGIFYGVTTEGNLEWNRYNGRGEQAGDPASVQRWHPNTGNLIGRGFGGMRQVFGCGDGVIMAIHPNGNLHWYAYDGNGESDVTGSLGWHPNSGHVIGNGWQNFRYVFVAPQAGPSVSRLKIFAVAENGDLHWYSYSGNGEHDPSGSLGWHPNSGNRVGNGWQDFRHVHGSSNVFFAVQENGNLLWYSYSGQGEGDPSGSLEWHPNSGNPVGRGWQNMKHIFGGVTDLGGFGHVIMAVDQNGDLFWYRYTGQGESDVTGSAGWDPRSGNPIGSGW